MKPLLVGVDLTAKLAEKDLPPPRCREPLAGSHQHSQRNEDFWTSDPDPSPLTPASWWVSSPTCLRATIEMPPC
jgi:hypothetical protein